MHTYTADGFVDDLASTLLDFADDSYMANSSKFQSESLRIRLGGAPYARATFEGVFG